MTFWRKLRWWLTPLGSECPCGHHDRYHHDGFCFYPCGPLGSDCGNCRTNSPRTLSEPSRSLSDEQEFTK